AHQACYDAARLIPEPLKSVHTGSSLLGSSHSHFGGFPLVLTCFLRLLFGKTLVDVSGFKELPLRGVDARQGFADHVLDVVLEIWGRDVFRIGARHDTGGFELADEPV